MELKPEIDGANLVLIGDFNPKIFQPAWFAAQQLIREQEASNAEIQIIHEALVSFSLEWLRLEVHQNRFFAATNQSPYFEVLRDLVVGAFRILKHTPIRMMGINRDLHYRMKSENDWHRLGDYLAPKQIWNEILKKPGMLSLSVEGLRPDEYNGRIVVKVQPSKRIMYGTYISINDHYEVRDMGAIMGAEEIIDILEVSWEKSLSRSEQIACKILESR